jgi:hypothetical protein
MFCAYHPLRTFQAKSFVALGFRMESAKSYLRHFSVIAQNNKRFIGVNFGIIWVWLLCILEGEWKDRGDFAKIGVQ